VVQGKKVKLRAVSNQDDTLIIYGYNYKIPLKANKPKSYSFKAKKAGIFVMQFQKQNVEVGELRVSPTS